MGVTSVVGPEWLNSNGQRRYPLAEDASAEDVTGSFRLPDSFLVGLYLAIGSAADVDPQRFFLRKLVAHAAGYVIEIAYDDDSESPPIAAGVTVAAASHVENGEYSLVGRGSFVDATGSVVIGNLAEIRATGAGMHLFDRDGGRLDPDCVRPQLRGLSALYVTSNQSTRGPFYDDVEIEAGSNVVFTVLSVEGGLTRIRIDGVDGAGLTASCGCTGSPALPDPIRTINGVPGNAQRNIFLYGTDCLEFSGSGSEILLANTCASPCCGCPELEAVSAELAHLRDEVAKLGAYAAEFLASNAAMSAIVLGTRLSDLPCD